MKNINWLDHFTNLLVVILGISIAFYLEGYRAEKENIAQERLYLESLIVDLEADLEALDTLLGINKMIIEATQNLSNATIKNTYSNGADIRNDVLIIQYNPPLVPQQTTYESLKASGRMDLIGDFELRKTIVDLYEQYYRGTYQYDQVLDEHLREFMKPFHMKHIRFTNSSVVEHDFLKNLEFQNIIFSYRYLFNSKNEFYKKVQIRIKEVKDVLEQRLEDLA